MDALSATYNIYSEIILETVNAMAESGSALIYARLAKRWRELLTECLSNTKEQMPTTVLPQAVASGSSLFDTGCSQLAASHGNATTFVSSAPPTRIENPNFSDEISSVPANNDENANADSDDWGDWENANSNDENRDDQASAAEPEASEEFIAGNESAEKASEPPSEESAMRLPQDKDFETLLTTKCGSDHQLIDFENLEVVNSDLDEVESLSYEEPEVTDTIIGYCEHFSRPRVRNSRCSGVWKFTMKGGICYIGGKEFLFDKIIGKFHF